MTQGDITENDSDKEKARSPEVVDPSFGVDWVYFLPPALQIISQIALGFMIPGILTVILKVWRDVTRSFWQWLLSFAPVDLSFLTPGFDGLTLSALLILAALGMRLRHRSKPQLPSALSKPTLVQSLAIAFWALVLVAVFSNGGIGKGYLIGVPRRLFSGTFSWDDFAALLTYILIIAVQTAVLAGLIFAYGRYRSNHLEEKLDLLRLEGKYGQLFLLSLPGLITISIASSGLIIILVFAIIVAMNLGISTLSEIDHRAMIPLSLCAMLLLFLGQCKLRTPNSSQIVEYGNYFLFIGLVLAILYVCFLPFFILIDATNRVIFELAASQFTEATIAVFFSFVASALFFGSIVYTAKVNWRIIPNILVVAIVLLGTDQVISLLLHAVSRH